MSSVAVQEHTATEDLQLGVSSLSFNIGVTILFYIFIIVSSQQGIVNSEHYKVRLTHTKGCPSEKQRILAYIRDN